MLLEHHPSYDEGAIAAGLAFGELIVAKAGYEWVRVEDEYGQETALSPKGKEIVCFPVSMIQKRIAQTEDIDIADLCDGAI